MDFEGSGSGLFQCTSPVFVTELRKATKIPKQRRVLQNVFNTRYLLNLTTQSERSLTRCITHWLKILLDVIFVL
jgi:hypothetical protein